MQNFVRKVKASAKKNPKRIVFPESTEERTLSAIQDIVNEKIAYPILIGNPSTIKKTAKKLKLKIDWKKVKIVDPLTSPTTKDYAKKMAEVRKEKGMTTADALKILKSPSGIYYYGTMTVFSGDADGMVTGAACSTGESVRPSLQIIKTQEKFHMVSGIFFMVLEKKMLLFADAAITIDPDAHDLVDIAEDTAKTAITFGIKPRIAFLSFSTKGSSNHPRAEKIRHAVEMLKDKYPELIADGEIQVDAALVPSVAKRKCPKSIIQGDANILIFPSLEAANIAYKLVERLAGARAIGPLLQGLRKPVNDLSRGCSINDIVNVTAFTVCQAQGGCLYCK